MSEERSGNFMNTFSGGRYWPLDPRPEDVHIVDIAHHLSMLCRYNGAVDRFYSVAEHSYRMSFLVDRSVQLQGLLHDATEAYLGDVIRPLKKYLPEYKRIERLNWLAVAARFGLPSEIDKSVHSADHLILVAEQRQLCRWYSQEIEEEQRTYLGLRDAKLPNVFISGWSPEEAKVMFLARYAYLKHEA